MTATDNIRNLHARNFEPPKDFPWSVAHARAAKYLAQLQGMVNESSPDVRRAINSAASYLRRADALHGK